MLPPPENFRILGERQVERGSPLVLLRGWSLPHPVQKTPPQALVTAEAGASQPPTLISPQRMEGLASEAQSLSRGDQERARHLQEAPQRRTHHVFHLSRPIHLGVSSLFQAQNRTLSKIVFAHPLV